MKTDHPLKKVKQLFDLIEELEIMYGFELEVKIVEPKFQRFGKGLIEKLIPLQQKANKLAKELNN